MQPIIDAIPTVVDLVSGVFDVIVGNPLLSVFVAVSLLGSGVAVFQQLRGAAH